MAAFSNIAGAMGYFAMLHSFLTTVPETMSYVGIEGALHHHFSAKSLTLVLSFSSSRLIPS